MKPRSITDLHVCVREWTGPRVYKAQTSTHIREIVWTFDQLTGA
jgi:hypothetical protein